MRRQLFWTAAALTAIAVASSTPEGRRRASEKLARWNWLLWSVTIALWAFLIWGLFFYGK